MFNKYKTSLIKKLDADDAAQITVGKKKKSSKKGKAKDDEHEFEEVVMSD